MKPVLIPKNPVITAAWLTYFIVMLGIGASRGWTGPLQEDESLRYLPALEYFANALPSIPISDYHFPGPPMGLAIQSLLYRYSNGSLTSIRILSSVWAVVLSLFILVHLTFRSESWRASLILLMIMCFPFLLKDTFTIKYHSLTVMLLIVAYTLWKKGNDECAARYLFLSCLFLILAITTNQMSAGLCLAFLLTNVGLHRVRTDPFAKFSVITALVPLLVLLALFLIWGGPQPPAYRNELLEREAGSLHLQPRQLVAGLLSLGVWLSPTMRMSMKRIAWVGILWLPCVVLVHLSGGYRPDVDFYRSIVGPISSTVKHMTANNYWLIVSIIGCMVAVGAAFLMPLEKQTKEMRLCKTYALVYLGMMNVVPYLFESYYLLLIVPSFWILKDQLVSDSGRRPVLVFQLLVPIAGICYTLAKLPRHV